MIITSFSFSFLENDNHILIVPSEAFKIKIVRITIKLYKNNNNKIEKPRATKERVEQCKHQQILEKLRKPTPSPNIVLLLPINTYN